uniref:Uncharacterized protein n=1 Tax=Caenorhabditis japonica TaxID=281687 RepID=A0A8R1DWP7_CAEJA
MTAETVATSSPESLPQQILDFLSTSDEFNSIQLADQWNLEHQKLIGAIKSLLANEGVLATKDVTEKRLELTGEGVQMADEGSYEFRVFEFVGAEGAAQADVMKQPFGKIGMAKAMGAKWVSMDKASGKVVRQAADVVDVVRKQLEALRTGVDENVTDKEKNELKKRKLISEVNIKGLLVSKGDSFTTSLAKQEADLTPEMIAS